MRGPGCVMMCSAIARPVGAPLSRRHTPTAGTLHPVTAKTSARRDLEVIHDLHWIPAFSARCVVTVGMFDESQVLRKPYWIDRDGSSH